MKLSKAREPAYEALKEAAKKRAQPLRFMSDLTTHDRVALARLGSDGPFAWFLGNDGTHLVIPSTRGSEHARAVEETFGREREHQAGKWFIWEGVAIGLREATFAEVEEFVSEQEFKSRSRVVSLAGGSR